MWLLKILVPLLCCQCTVGYKILCIFPTPSRSHGYLAKGIVDPLLKAGHQVTWVSPFTDWKPHQNLTLIGVPKTLDLINQVDDTSDEVSMAEMKEFAKAISDLTLNNEEVRKVLMEEQFDAVVTEWFFTDNDAGYAAIQQAPWIMLSGVVMHYHLEFLIDEVRSISTVPFITVEANVPMDFCGRIQNSLHYLYMTFTRLFETASEIQKYESDFQPLAKARGVSLPPYDDAIHNIAVLFVNSHPLIEPAVAMPKNALDIGGYHIEEDIQPLPKDLQTLLDNSLQGVIYFSMGSVIRDKDIRKSTIIALTKLFGELKHTVLWKYDQPIDALPNNVHTRAWFPQASILAHPKTVLFITHGGLLSLLEAVKYGVPLLALPVYWDQPSNAATAVRIGLGRSIPWRQVANDVMSLKEETLEMLRNRSYSNRAQDLSRVFNSRPVSQSKLINHYIEMAIETKGAYHLRSVSRLYPWWARWMIDQLLAVAALAGILVFAARRLLASTLATLTGKDSKKEKPKRS